MKKLNKVAMMFAVAALATAAGAQTRSPAANGGTVDRQLAERHRRTGLEKRHQRTVLARCQLDAGHRRRSVATARSFHGAVLLPLLCSPRLAPAPVPLRPCPGSPAVAATKVTYAADAFFDFDKAVLKPEGRAKLDDLVGKIQWHQPGSDHRRGPHRLRSALMPTTSACPCAAPKPSRPTWSPRASKATASTPKARARSSPWPTTRPSRRPRQEPPRGNRSGRHARQPLIPPQESAQKPRSGGVFYDISHCFTLRIPAATIRVVS
jgi:outer membrane protein OmpA-like peptidoglycan-associated protein